MVKPRIAAPRWPAAISQAQSQEATMEETPLERAQRRVAEEQALAKAQADRVADLARRGLDTAQAEAVLAGIEQTLRFLHEDIAREQERAAGNQQ
jgi:hypothetical protein